VLFPRSMSRLIMRMVLTSSFSTSLCFWKVEEVIEGQIHRVSCCKILLGDNCYGAAGGMVKVIMIVEVEFVTKESILYSGTGWKNRAVSLTDEV
jgi:hypothetical protein